MVSDIKLDIPKFDTALLHSNWSNLRRKYLSGQIPTDINVLSCGPKAQKISWISDAISPARHSQKSSQHVRACAAGDGAICSKNRKLSHIMGPTPILEMARAYGLRPRLWLLMISMISVISSLSLKLYLNSLVYHRNIFGSSSKVFGDLRTPSEIFGNFRKNVRERSSDLRDNFGKSSESGRKSSENHQKRPSSVCLYNKKNITH